MIKERLALPANHRLNPGNTLFRGSEVSELTGNYKAVSVLTPLVRPRKAPRSLDPVSARKDLRL
jgi:hypothetical protein